MYLGLQFQIFMNTVLKTILFLGLAAALLVMPLSAGADEILQDPPSVALATSTSISLNSRGTAQCPVLHVSVEAVASSSVSLHETVEPGVTVVSSDGRSKLRSSCLLRC